MNPFIATSLLAFGIVIVAVSAVTILINIFFICCMFSSQEGPGNQQKPLLNILLGSHIGSNLIFSICIILFLLPAFAVPDWIYLVLFGSMLYALRSSFTASLGLNVFYYFQIVPARQPFLIWVKTHIKLLIYLILFFGNIFIISGLIWTFIGINVCFNFKVYRHSSSASLNSSSPSLNSSFASLNITFEYPLIGDPCYLKMTDFCLRCVYFLVGLGIMVASNTSTVLYLWRHVRRMENSSSFPAPHYQNQKRVTILSIIQTLLFFIYSVGLLIYEFKCLFFLIYDFHMYFIVFAFYCFFTSIILGVGQTKFRLCAVEIWKKIGQAVSQSNLTVSDRNGYCNCCFCYSNTENVEMLTIAHI